MLVYNRKLINEVSIMLNIEIYEEAMCCSTGVCGPKPDETLIKTNQINEYLKQNQQRFSKLYPEFRQLKFANKSNQNKANNLANKTEIKYCLLLQRHLHCRRRRRE